MGAPLPNWTPNAWGWPMGKRGPQAWVPSDEELQKIRLYSGLGSTQDQIAVLIGKSWDTIAKHENAVAAWGEGHAEMVAKVAGSLVKKALAGDTASAIFYLKTQGKWKETIVNEHTGPDSGPVQIGFKIIDGD